jgi:hypothetical protein
VTENKTDDITLKDEGYIGVGIESPSQKMFYPGWINALNIGSDDNVPGIFRRPDVKVAMRCHNLLRTLSLADAESTSNWDDSVEKVLNATKLFTTKGLTKKGALFQRHCLGYLTFCCNQIKPFVMDEVRWAIIRNELFRRIVPQDGHSELSRHANGWWA